MIIAASIIDYDNERINELEEFLKKYTYIDIETNDNEKGKMVITIEAENNSVLEDFESEIKACDFVIDFSHYAFHFEDEVNKVLEGGSVPDFDASKPFTRKKFI